MKEVCRSIETQIRGNRNTKNLKDVDHNISNGMVRGPNIKIKRERSAFNIKENGTLLNEQDKYGNLKEALPNTRIDLLGAISSDAIAEENENEPLLDLFSNSTQAFVAFNEKG